MHETLKTAKNNLGETKLKYRFLLYSYCIIKIHGRWPVKSGATQK